MTEWRKQVSGHTFVVNGRLESLVWDAVVIPTDRWFNVVGKHWSKLLGGEPQQFKPADWGSSSPHGRAVGDREIWFLDVTAPNTGLLPEMLEGLRELLIEIATSPPAPGVGRALPLVAMPVTGIGRGGFAGQTGEAIRGLLKVTGEVTAMYALDVAIVAARKSAFAALQAERRRQNRFDKLTAESARPLGEMAAEGRLALLLGAGVSMPAGLPSWRDLVADMRDIAETKDEVLAEVGFADMGVLDQAELLQRVLGDGLQEHVAARVKKVETPALSHALLAGLGCLEVITTNYDHCFEIASKAQSDKQSAVVLPWGEPQPKRPWILKLHGDVDEPSSIVLTRAHFIGYDSTWRPAGSLFQSVLLTRHLLVVGASLTDDNILRLTHEAKEFRHKHGVMGLLGTVLTLESDPLRARLWRDEMTWIGMGGDGPDWQARQLEIFLDAISMFACTDGSYLLDPDFEGLLPTSQRNIAKRARDLATDLANLPASSIADWSSLSLTLSQLGADAMRQAGNRVAPLAGERQTLNVTANDMARGYIRVTVRPKRSLEMPPGMTDLMIRVRGADLWCIWDPRLGPNRERSGLLRIGVGRLTELLGLPCVLAIGRAKDGILDLR